MKWFIILAVAVSAYAFTLIKSADIVLAQTQQIQHQYMTVAETADQVAAGAKYPIR